MLRTIFFIFAVYFIYKFIFEFLIPLFTATKQMQQNIRSMQQDMNRLQQTNPQTQQQASTEEKAPEHEYIDFEEVK
jgi:cell division protein FtsB